MRIARITRCRADAARVMIYFEDRSYCKVDALLAQRLGLEPGMEVDGEVLPALSEDARRGAAREAAARILGRRSLSRWELITKLTARGISEADAQLAADWAEERGVVDDVAYAGQVARHYRLKGFGDARVRQELTRRGIDRELIDQMLSQPVDMSEEILTFLRRKTRGEMPDADTIRRITEALRRRGHSFENIHAAFRALEIELEEWY